MWTQFLNAHTLLAMLSAVGIVLIAGETLEARERTRVERLRRRLGYLMTDTRAEDLVMLPQTQTTWQRLSSFLGQLGGRFLPKRAMTAYRTLLIRAGQDTPRALSVLIATKLLCGFCSMAISLALVPIFFAHTLGVALVLGLGGLALGYLLPDLWLQQRTRTHALALRASIAPGVDLIGLGLEAGLSLDSAISYMVSVLDDPFAHEMRIYVQLRTMGTSRRQALDQVIGRTQVPEFAYICTTIVQGDSLGTGFAPLLQEAAVDLRRRHRQRMTEQVQTASLRMIFPLVIFIMPALFIVLLGPAVYAVTQSMH